MKEFHLPAPPLLSRSAVDRSEPLRSDTARQITLWPTARVLLLDDSGRTPVRDDGSLALRPAVDLADEPPRSAVLLGEADGTAYWGYAVTEPDRREGEHWRDLRRCGADLDSTGAGLVTTAVAVLGWHERARFCAVDGSPTQRRAAGWARFCVQCGQEEYPRTDPAVICLVRDIDDTHVLLARQPTWPVGRFSVLAGFVEAGESLEACVAREVAEEVGAAVRELHYLGSQPWPFPRSLMLGFAAVADIDVPLVPADGEIAEARWVSRAELRSALTIGGWARREGDEPVGDGGAAPLLLPDEVSIARRMLAAWAAGS